MDPLERWPPRMALQLLQRGLRERLSRAQGAPGCSRLAPSGPAAARFSCRANESPPGIGCLRFGCATNMRYWSRGWSQEPWEAGRPPRQAGPLACAGGSLTSLYTYLRTAQMNSIEGRIRIALHITQHIKT